MHYYAIFMHSACVHVHVHAHICTIHVMHSTCWNAAVQFNRPSGISQAAAIAVHRPQGVKKRKIILDVLKYGPKLH